FGEHRDAPRLVDAQNLQLLFLSRRLHIHLDHFGDLGERLKTGVAHKVVESDRVAFLVKLPASGQKFRVRLDRFENLEYQVFPRNHGVQTAHQQNAIEIHESLLAADYVFEANREEAVRNHLRGRRSALGAVKFVALAVGPEQELIPIEPTCAVEDGLAGDEHVHALPSASWAAALA